VRKNRKTLASWAATPSRRGIIKRAASDVAAGRQDTDARSRGKNLGGKNLARGGKR
jgi:hypothetical protein